MDIDERITELEIRMTEVMRVNEELSDIVADQATRLDKAEKRIHMLMQRAAEAEAQSMNGVAMGDVPPPHY